MENLKFGGHMHRHSEISHPQPKNIFEAQQQQ